MLRSVKELFNYVLEAEDGEIERCKDFLFDDEHWTKRYMVADTGKWLPGRKVLISPLSLGDPNWATRQLVERHNWGPISDSNRFGFAGFQFAFDGVQEDVGAIVGASGSFWSKIYGSLRKIP